MAMTRRPHVVKKTKNYPFDKSPSHTKHFRSLPTKIKKKRPPSAVPFHFASSASACEPRVDCEPRIG
jgi:hypothetical protein